MLHLRGVFEVTLVEECVTCSCCRVGDVVLGSAQCWCGVTRRTCATDAYIHGWLSPTEAPGRSWTEVVGEDSRVGVLGPVGQRLWDVTCPGMVALLSLADGLEDPPAPVTTCRFWRCLSDSLLPFLPSPLPLSPPLPCPPCLSPSRFPRA